MAQSWAESTWDTYNYGQYINQFPPNTIKAIWEYERIQKKICRQKMSLMVNEICTHIYIYIYKQMNNEIIGKRENYFKTMKNQGPFRPALVKLNHWKNY